MSTRAKKQNDAASFLEQELGAPLTFASLLEAVRLGEEQSQAVFAAKLGISRSHLCDIEHGRKAVSVQRAAEFAHVLGYSAEQFVRLALQALY